MQNHDGKDLKLHLSKPARLWHCHFIKGNATITRFYEPAKQPLRCGRLKEMNESSILVHILIKSVS